MKKELPKRKRMVLVISIAIASFLILIGIGYFFYLIYHKDEPQFIPGETRGEVREGIRDGLGETTKKIWPDLGQKIIDGAYQSPASQSQTASAGQSNPATNSDPTANWQTYKNEQYGFEVKYPEGWEVLSNENVVSFSRSPLKENTDQLAPIEITKTSDKTIEQEIASIKESTIKDYKEEDATIAGMPAKKISGYMGLFYWGEARHEFLLFSRENVLYNWSVFSEDENLQSNFESMIQTFKFTK